MKKTILCLLIFILLSSVVYAVPGSWYGYVTLDSSTASDGVVVDAYISSSIAATTTVGAVQSNGYYLIHVEGNVGDSVSFKIYGNTVTQAAQAWATDLQPILNLTATSTANAAACPTYSGYTSGTNVVNLGCAGGYCVHDICRAASTYCGDDYCDTGESCSADNSACASGYACTNGCQSTGGGGGGGGSTTTTCTEDWACTNWLSCTPEGIQTRSCSDQNACGTAENKPEETRSCTYTSPLPEKAIPSPEQKAIPAPISEEAIPPALKKPTIIPLGFSIFSLIILIIIAMIIIAGLRKKKKKT